MKVFTAKQVIDHVSFILKDPENVRWLRPIVLDYVNEAQLAVVRMLPSANRVRTTIKLQEGTLQELPDDALSLISVVKNVCEGVPGRAIRLATRSVFDAMFPDWHDAWPEDVVQNYIYDDREDTQFEVFPPNDGTGEVEVVYSAIPKQVEEEETLSIGAEYSTIITNYVLYKCALLDSDFNGTQGLAQYYYQLFLTELKGQDESAAKQGPSPSHASAPIGANGGTE